MKLYDAISKKMGNNDNLINISKGCGGVMRVAPAGALAYTVAAVIEGSFSAEWLEKIELKEVMIKVADNLPMGYRGNDE